MKGPLIHSELMLIIPRLRFYNYVMTADVEKMYRQIMIHKEDTKFRKILQREKPEEPLHPYTLQTVTYGTTSAPFLAIRCLKHQFALAPNAIQNDFYVDDMLTGTHNLSEVKQLQQNITKLLREGGFVDLSYVNGKPIAILIFQETLTSQGQKTMQFHMTSWKTQNLKFKQ